MLDHSIVNIVMVPITIKIAVKNRANFEWKDKNLIFLCDFFNCIRSFTTTKPIPPKIVKTLIVITTIRSFLNGIKLQPGEIKPFISRPELQYDETEVNIAIKIPCNPYWLQKGMHKNAAPINSQNNVMRITFTNKDEILAKSFVVICELANRMFFKLNFLFNDRENIDEKVTKPKPPICIKHIIID